MDLKTLLKETLPAYYEAASSKNTYVYTSSVDKVINDTKQRLDELRVEQIQNGNDEVAHGIRLAKDEIAFTSSEIMLEQLKTLRNE